MISVGVIARGGPERAELRAALEAEGRHLVAGEGEPGGELSLVRRARPRVLVVGQHDEDSALTALHRVAAVSTPVAVVLLAHRFTCGGLRRILSCRPAGVLHRATAAAHLPWAVGAAAAGGPVLGPELVGVVVGACTCPGCAPAARDEARTLIATLSTRELEVLELVGEGLSNPQIAAALTISSDTAKDHLGSICGKLGIRGRLQAARVAWQAGLTGRRGSSAGRGPTPRGVRPPNTATCR
ncbi:helix-turn-helix transcriptional regulator [Streptomyces aureocirculatus]|uniref:helix-turn-helix transcriptional regulator n=1 Tax=Streptomyces aureocirculatus TaxID=67275 RepID=UPI00068DFE4B|nr:LuxR C-terminal-related transcriptional regulator [Streptomyces aureocirculatus]